MFTKPSNLDVWYKGLLAEFIIANGKIKSYDLIWVKQTRDAFRVELTEESESNQVIEEVNEINKFIENNVILKSKLNEF